MKAGFLRKTGAPSSDEASVRMRFLRHGEYMTVVEIIEDPIYLAEPWILSRTFQQSANPLSVTGPPCVTTTEATTRETAPHYLPEKNPFVDELTKKYGVPRDAVLGKPETLYPEFKLKMQAAAAAK
jgi:hypothetical protein